MWIIVEGPDLAGKSTLCDQLDKWFIEHGIHAQRRHAGPLRAGVHPLDAYVRPMLGYRPHHLNGVPRVFIDDRWHLGEAIYPAVIGRKSRFDAGVQLYTELFIRSRGGIIVGVLPELHVLHERYDQNGDSFIRRDMLSHLYYAYSTIFEKTVTIAPRIDVIIENARRDAEAVRTDGTLPLMTYVGPPKPRVLFMGDQRSRTDIVLGPAFMPYPATSGHYLLNALATQSRLWQRQIGIANACDVDKPGVLWQTLGKPIVVALGANAHNALRVARIQHSWVPHPQYIRRFYHRELAAYGNVLATAAISEGVDLSSWRP